MAFSWKCPYCGHNATIGDANSSAQFHGFEHGNKDGSRGIVTQVVVCPNPECKEYVISACLTSARKDGYDRLHRGTTTFERWALKPKSRARPLPDYIPKPIVDDYEEACAIRDLSPKASATLSRRCLQGMIRDFFGVSKGSLAKEIESIEDKVDSVTWQSIDAVRKIGNIGAHMEKDINIVVDVEPNEAQILIDLVESLIDDWYVARHERAKRHSAIQAIAAEKTAAKMGVADTSGASE